ncbi:hypothetical protein BuS5_01267 [Desulfosarcina sp. BuS5]|uniref:hypothetical protein n=1 Tax=Desulfosarcina sp. BuS5 TaxID=933262 RepID=UPI00048A032E|nr:hypothetical protein [Desulfosarcina sp. BuS5]WDN88299.1 hypothetical protein BuS5_01267 [Desulfosarcina sp. BuS5]
MLASERLLEIEEKFEAKVERIVPVELDEKTLRVILYLKDGTNLRKQRGQVFILDKPHDKGL